jgi:phosphatidylinositol-3-phosphatase
MPRLVLLVALAVTACGGARPVALPEPGAVKRPSSSHVVVIVMENEEAGSVLGTGRAPFVDRLARTGALATRSYAIRHPSLPNYIALTSGSTHGIASDCTSCHVGARSIADQLEAAHLSWRAYMEDLPRPCFAGARAGRYAKKHDPFMYYDAVARHPARCRHVVGFGALARDLRRGTLPAFAFISPNLCHDGHDCSVGVADRFLRRLVPSLRRALGPHGYLVLTWDEGSTGAGCCAGARGGRIVTILAGPRVRAGARHAAPVDHYGVLATIEDSLKLPRLGAARDPAHGNLSDLLTSPAPIR